MSIRSLILPRASPLVGSSGGSKLLVRALEPNSTTQWFAVAAAPINRKTWLSTTAGIASASASQQQKVFNTIESYRAWRKSLSPSLKLGFVPTMGALHDGHLSLIRHAAQECDKVVVSIFLNPAQFAPTEDLDAYPRTLDSDVSMLSSLNSELSSSSSTSSPSVDGKGKIEAVFAPSVREMYPLGIPLDTSKQIGTFVTVTPLSSRLEGVTRPHFFRGVATVCTKLFNVVQPTHVYFGQKDVQQTVVLRRIIADLLMPITLRVCPTVREADGLAMSSRNVHLGGTRRKVAPVLHMALKAAEALYESGQKDRERILGAARKVIDEHAEDGARIKLDYVSLAEGEMLDEVETVEKPGAILSGALLVLPTTAEERTVRIIDNIILK